MMLATPFPIGCSAVAAMVQSLLKECGPEISAAAVEIVLSGTSVVKISAPPLSVKSCRDWNLLSNAQSCKS